jgi:RNA polymerase sigma-70 factor (ECF subfamily)
VFSTPVSLLTRLRIAPSRESWDRFVELYAPVLLAWAGRLRLPADQAEDLVQDVFAVLLEQLPRFEYDPTRSFRAWLKTVLLNGWRRRQRRAGAAAAALPDVAAPDEPFEIEEEEYRAWLVGRALELMRAEFEPTTWRACWEFVVSGRPAADVAAELGVTVNAVYLAKGRVLRRLREELSEFLD